MGSRSTSLGLSQKNTKKHQLARSRHGQPLKRDTRCARRTSRTKARNMLAKFLHAGRAAGQKLGRRCSKTTRGSMFEVTPECRREIPATVCQTHAQIWQRHWSGFGRNRPRLIRVGPTLDIVLPTLVECGRRCAESALNMLLLCVCLRVYVGGLRSNEYRRGGQHWRSTLGLTGQLRRSTPAITSGGQLCGNEGSVRPDAQRQPRHDLRSR